MPRTPKNAVRTPPAYDTRPRGCAAAAQILRPINTHQAGRPPALTSRVQRLVAPQLQHLVLAATRNARAVGAPVNTEHLVGVARQVHRQLPRAQVPHLACGRLRAACTGCRTVRSRREPHAPEESAGSWRAWQLARALRVLSLLALTNSRLSLDHATCACARAMPCDVLREQRAQTPALHANLMLLTEDARQHIKRSAGSGAPDTRRRRGRGMSPQKPLSRRPTV